MSLFDDDLETIFADPLITVSAKIGASKARGILEWKDVIENDGSGFVPVSRRVLSVVVGSLVGLAVDVDIVVDGTTYRVRDFRHSSQKLQDIILA